jgi:plastocyanin
MKRLRSINVLAILIGIFCMTGVTVAAEKGAGEIKVISKIVTISTLEGIMPNTVTSSPGTTVVWVNHDRMPIEILFLDKKVVLACGSPVNFFIGKDGAYESAKIPFGGTASLCFLEKGKYEYVFRGSSTFYPATKKEHRGIIWIK